MHLAEAIEKDTTAAREKLARANRDERVNLSSGIEPDAYVRPDRWNDRGHRVTPWAALACVVAAALILSYCKAHA